MLDYYKNKIINMHLGLSPYYRGSATNFWPLVDDCPECVGVTIHHATLRVDGGNILAQARPSVVESDDSHDLGCKSIIKGAELLSKIIQTEALPTGYKQEEMVGKLCRSKDFDEDMLMKLLYNFDGGMMFDYVNNKKYRDKKYPIVI